jgi:hypothetical protein
MLLKMRAFLIPISLLAIMVILGCKSNQCESNAHGWIQNAPAALDEFLLVKAEILSNKAFVDSFSKHGYLFVGGAFSDTDKFAGFVMPHLKEWFRNGRNYIAFEPNDTTACYQDCESGSFSASAEIHQVPFNRKKYYRSVKVMDSLKLKEGWNAQVVYCYKCDD